MSNVENKLRISRVLGAVVTGLRFRSRHLERVGMFCSLVFLEVYLKSDALPCKTKRQYLLKQILPFNFAQQDSPLLSPKRLGVSCWHH